MCTGCAEILPIVAELNQVNNQQFGNEVSKLIYCEYNICNQTSEVILVVFSGIIYHKERKHGQKCTKTRSF